MPYRLSRRAASDLDDIWHYIAVQSGSEALADRQVDTLVDRFLLLVRHPRLGRVRDDIGVGRRSFPVGDTLIIYRIVQGDVHILRLVHGRRDLVALFGPD